MKKFMFILMVALLGSISKSAAQNTLVATLTHGDEITMFYGVNAFVQAHNAAVDGDIINLSGGKFNSTTITKGITIRGVGTSTNTKLPTTITGKFYIEIPANDSERLNFEGCITNDVYVKGTLSNAYFLKSKIGNLVIPSLNDKMINGIFVNCHVYGMDIVGISSVQFFNSYVQEFMNRSSAPVSVNFINCVVKPYSRYHAQYLSSVQLINSILWNDNPYTSFNNLPSTSSAWNSVAVGLGNTTVFNDLSAKENCTAVDFEIFMDGYPLNDLTDESKTKYLGTDGTPVGMFGGAMPFSLTPTYPQITKMNVANKTTADGKLSVEIEVSAME